MEFSEQRIKELQKILENESGKEISYEDAEESARNLWNLFEFVMRWDEKNRRLQKRLEQEPKGFHLEGGPYSCCICRANISGV